MIKYTIDYFNDDINEIFFPFGRHSILRSFNYNFRCIYERKVLLLSRRLLTEFFLLLLLFILLHRSVWFGFFNGEFFNNFFQQKPDYILYPVLLSCKFRKHDLDRIFTKYTVFLQSKKYKFFKSATRYQYFTWTEILVFLNRCYNLPIYI